MLVAKEKPKRGRPPLEADAGTVRMGFRCSKRWEKWCLELVEHISAKTGWDIATSDVLKRGVVLLAESEGFREPPEK